MQTMLVPHYRDFAKIRREKVTIVAVKIFSKFENIWVKLCVDFCEFIALILREIINAPRVSFVSKLFAVNLPK
ncbi:hypothetical protein [Helicobacter sp. T3_23-1059]